MKAGAVKIKKNSENNKWNPTSSFAGFEVSVTFVDVASETKIRDFAYLTGRYQHISCSQISMNQLVGIEKGHVKALTDWATYLPSSRKDKRRLDWFARQTREDHGEWRPVLP